MDTSTDIKTFRGRTLEEVLPQVRSELGPDAIVVRRREGLAGEDVGDGLARGHRQLERRAGARGLVGVGERDVGDAERPERAGQLVGGGGAERGRKRQVDLLHGERLQVGGKGGDGRTIAWMPGDDRPSAVARSDRTSSGTSSGSDGRASTST